MMASGRSSASFCRAPFSASGSRGIIGERQAELLGGAPALGDLEILAGVQRIGEHGKPPHRWEGLLQQLDALGVQLDRQEGDAGQVLVRRRERGGPARGDRIAREPVDDRDAADDADRIGGGADGDDHVGLFHHQVARQLRHALRAIVAKLRHHDEAPALDMAELGHALAEDLEIGGVDGRVVVGDPADPRRRTRGLRIDGRRDEGEQQEDLGQAPHASSPDCQGPGRKSMMRAGAACRLCQFAQPDGCARIRFPWPPAGPHMSAMRAAQVRGRANGLDSQARCV